LLCLLLALLAAPHTTDAQTAALSCSPASGSTPATKATQIVALAAGGGCSVTFSASNAVSGTAPSTYGVNAGHAFPWSGGLADGSWIAFMSRLGVNGVRNFGINGLGASPGRAGCEARHAERGPPRQARTCLRARPPRAA